MVEIESRERSESFEDKGCENFFGTAIKRLKGNLEQLRDVSPGEKKRLLKKLLNELGIFNSQVADLLGELEKGN